MSLGKVARKLKRVGKSAVQFRFISTFEDVELSLSGSWRPDTLRVVWMRNHRKVKSTDVKWVPTEDRGPNGADGKAVFDPVISVALIVTLYRESGHMEFQEKEYKYYIENYGPNGKKTLASFHCDMSEYAGVPSAEHALAMTFKPVSVKVTKAVLGITLKSEFIKQGSAMDDDMLSTFSAMSAGTDASYRDDEDEDDIDDGPALNKLSVVMEDDEAQLRKTSEASRTSDRVSVRKQVQSQDEYCPPPNPYLADEEEEIEESMEPPSPSAAWLVEEAMFVDCFGEAVGREKLDRADLIALYFSASWCPPCRRFLPKLVKFYHHLKQNGKSFELLYISSDYSKQETMKYMQQQQMPWVGLAFEGKVALNLQKMFSVAAIPQLKIVSTKGEMIEEAAKKPVEAASSGADVLRLYNKWHEKLDSSEDAKEKGLTQKTQRLRLTKSRSGTGSDSVDGGVAQSGGGSKQLVKKRDSKCRSIISHKGKLKETSLDEKDERIHRLEEINMALKQSNDDLNEEVADLKRQLEELQAKMDEMEKSSKKLEDDKKETIAKLSTRGWLYKKGIKGPTANIWRRRYFRCDQGSKICYYKSAAEGTPQGFIDLAKLISVQEVSPAQQDKNNATFLVQCDGRTFQLQAYDEATMRKWMSAIEYLGRWHKSNSMQNGARP